MPTKATKLPSRKNQAERRRGALRARLVGKAPIVSSEIIRARSRRAPTTAGVPPAAHVRGAEVGRLLVDEQDEAKARLPRLQSLEQAASSSTPRCRWRCRWHPARPRRSRNARRGSACRPRVRLRALVVASMLRTSLPRTGRPGGRRRSRALQRALDVLGRSFQRFVMLDVVGSLAMATTCVLSRPAKSRSSVVSAGRGPMMAAPGHCQHVPGAERDCSNRQQHKNEGPRDPGHACRSCFGHSGGVRSLQAQVIRSFAARATIALSPIRHAWMRMCRPCSSHHPKSGATGEQRLLRLISQFGHGLLG